MTLLCVCCGLELEPADVEVGLVLSPTFDGHCRDCVPNHTPGEDCLR